MDLKFGLDFKCQKVAYDVDKNVTYIGYHEDSNVPDSDTKHYLVKLTLDGDDDVTKMQLSQGDWTNRADYFV